MKITIDTKEDTHEEIKKVIDILHSMVGSREEVVSNQGDVFSDETPESSASADMFSMFGSDNPSDNDDSETESSNAAEAKEEESRKTQDMLDLDIPDLEEYD